MTEKRRLYLKNYRIKNRDRLYKYHKEYLRKTGRKYYRHRIYGNLRGTCGMGRMYELLALNLLEGAKDCNKDSFHGKYDIEWKSMRIDVKSTNFYSRTKCWRFTLRNTDCFDALLLYCILDGCIKKVLLIPVSILPKSRVFAIYRVSKYDKYEIPVK